MPRSALTGSRIRERRLLAGMKQADLARVAGVSASYLNLIEHNRRPVSDGLLAALASALGVDVALLREGAELAQLALVRDAAAQSSGGAEPELDRAEEFLGRFPGWAALLAETQGKAAMLERNLADLNDRMAHDPYLPAALHEVLSAVTSVRATAGILADTEDLDPQWQRRFHQNLNEDAVRLTDAASGLAAYLASTGDGPAAAATPQEEAETWVAHHASHFPALETGSDRADALPEAADLTSRAGRDLATRWCRAYAADAARLPLAAFRAAWAATGADPLLVAAQFGVGLSAVLRRVATVPGIECGLAIADGSGALTWRKPLAGFAFPRFGAACPLWPLYRSLPRPGQPIRAELHLPGPMAARFLAYAVSDIAYPAGFDGAEVVTATMLILPLTGAVLMHGPTIAVGTSCRICPRAGCPARRESSILTEET